ncbi:MAG: hypothetical protein VX498_03800 [Myxococcota bacterium]|nr:hypothetical protein [Myxococcota bacterium]
MLRLSAGLALTLFLTGCAGPVPSPSVQCSLTPAELEVGSPITLSVRLEGVLPKGSLRLVLPHPWYGLPAAASGDVVVRASVDGEARSGEWVALDYGHKHAVLDGAAGSEIELTVWGLLAPSTPGSFEPVVLWGKGKQLQRICPSLSFRTVPGPTEKLDLTAPTTARPGETVSLGLLHADRLGNPAAAPEAPARLEWIPISAANSGPVIDLPSSHPAAAARFEVPAPPPGLWLAEIRSGKWVGRSNSLLVEEEAPREFWADLHGHGALSDGWRDPAAWFQHARDTAFLDVVSLTEHAWQLTREEWAELVTATDAAQVPGRFVTLPALEVNVVGHEVAYLRDAEALAGAGAAGGAMTIWEETDLRRQPSVFQPQPRDWVRGEGVLVVPHTSLHHSMGAALPDDRLGPLALVEVYSAHGSSMERGGWRSVAPKGGGRGGWTLQGPVRQSSVLELLQEGEQIGFIAAGDSHDGRPGTSVWGGQRGGLTALRLPSLGRAEVWEGLRARRTVASSGRRVHVDAQLGGQIFGQEAAPGILRYRVADLVSPARIILYRDGRPERDLPIPGPAVWAETPVGGTFGTLHLEVVLHDDERLWISPWFGTSPPAP